jgi:hypothetical protein
MISPSAVWYLYRSAEATAGIRIASVNSVQERICVNLARMISWALVCFDKGSKTTAYILFLANRAAASKYFTARV